jgi:integrase
VQWRTGGKAKTEFFPTAKARNDRARALLKARREGCLVQMPTRAELADWQAFQTAAGGVPWQDVISGWKAHLRASGGTGCATTVQQAVDTYLKGEEALVARRELAPETFRQKKQKLEKFATSFGAQLLSEVAGAAVENWIEDDLGFDNPHTFNNWRKHIRSLFDAFKKEVPYNPMEDVDKRNDATEHVGILTPEQTAKLFHHAHQHHPEALGRIALEAFAGLRFSSAFRLEKADINFDDRGINLPKHKLKTGRRHFIDGLPENLWLWLAETNDACWTLTPAEYLHLKSRIFTDAKVPHPRNCLRHSFCTYHVAAFKNPGRTAILLTHQNQQMLWQRYNGLTTQAAGGLYWSITPQSAASIAAKAGSQHRPG